MVCPKARKSTDFFRNQCFSMVGVSGFEPEASWTRTKRDTKLRHTPLPRYYNEESSFCQAEKSRFPHSKTVTLFQTA